MTRCLGRFSIERVVTYRRIAYFYAYGGTVSIWGELCIVCKAGQPLPNPSANSGGIGGIVHGEVSSIEGCRLRCHGL